MEAFYSLQQALCHPALEDLICDAQINKYKIQLVISAFPEITSHQKPASMNFIWTQHSPMYLARKNMSIFDRWKYKMPKVMRSGMFNSTGKITILEILFPSS